MAKETLKCSFNQKVRARWEKDPYGTGNTYVVSARVGKRGAYTNVAYVGGPGDRKKAMLVELVELETQAARKIHADALEFANLIADGRIDTQRGA